MMSQTTSFTCPHCAAVSHNLNDAAQRYCGQCHRFVDDPALDMRDSVAIKRILAELKEEAANGAPNQYNRVYTRHMRS